MGLFGMTPWAGWAFGFSVFSSEALPNIFSENGFTREAPVGKSHFLYYGGETKKSGFSGSSNSLGKAIYKGALPNMPYIKVLHHHCPNPYAKN
jgi:hypothetical protein